MSFLNKIGAAFTIKIYLAGPLFTESERDWIRNLKKEIEQLAESQDKQVSAIWPYELITQSDIDRLGEKAKFEIFSRCKSHLETTNILIALLDVSPGGRWDRMGDRLFLRQKITRTENYRYPV